MYAVRCRDQSRDGGRALRQADPSGFGREHGFRGGYTSVKRFVRRLAATVELPFRRMECDAGRRVAVRLWPGRLGRGRGQTAAARICSGAVLSHSRKGYSEVVWRQDTETFLRCLENAFRAFGGVAGDRGLGQPQGGGASGRLVRPRAQPEAARLLPPITGRRCCPRGPRCPATKARSRPASSTPRTTRSKAGSLAVWPRKTRSWPSGSAPSPTPAFTAPSASRSARIFCRPSGRRSAAAGEPVPQLRRGASARCIATATSSIAKAYYSVPPEYVGRQVWVRAETRLAAALQPADGADRRCTPGPSRAVSPPPTRTPTAATRIIERGAEYLLERCRLIGAALRRLGRGPDGPARGRRARGSCRACCAGRSIPSAELEARHRDRPSSSGPGACGPCAACCSDGDTVVQLDFLQDASADPRPATITGLKPFPP